MIEYFEDLERYEDCALLVEIKERVKRNHYKKLWLNG